MTEDPPTVGSVSASLSSCAKMEDTEKARSLHDYEASASAVDAVHRAVSCFYGLLSVLQLPLTQFVTLRRAIGPQLPHDIESQHVTLAKAGVRMQLLFVRDHWATHFEMLLPASALVDVKLLLHVQQQIHFSAAASVKLYHKGIEAIERLLRVVGGSDHAKQQLATLKTLLAVDFSGLQPGDAQVATSQVSSGNRRVVLTHQAKQIMDAHEHEEGDEIDVAAYEEAIGLLTSALEISSTPNQRCRALVMRSECQAKCGRKELACEDGEAALATQIALTKWTATKLLGVFKVVGKWTAVVATCDSALRSDPDDAELFCEKALALEMAAKPVVVTTTAIETQAVREHNAGDIFVEKAQGDIHVREVEGEDADVQQRFEGDDVVPRVVKELSECLYASSAADLSDLPMPTTVTAVSDDSGSSTPPLDGKKSGTEVLEDGSKASFLEITMQELPPATIKARVTPRKDSKELRTAKSCVDLRDFQEAIFWIDKELVRTKKKPQHHASLYALRAQCQFGLREYECALADAREAVALDNTTVDAYRWMCEALLNLGRVREAHSSCSAGRKVDRSNERLKELEKEISRKSLAAHAIRVTKLTADKLNEAISDQQNSVVNRTDNDSWSTTSAPIEPPPWKAAVQIGLGFVQNASLVAAEDAFTKAFNLLADEEDPVEGQVNVLGHRARCRLSMKRYELAVSDARQGLALKPQWLEGHRLACKGLMGLEQWSEALKECNFVLFEAPQDSTFSTLRTEINSKVMSTAEALSSTAKTAPWYPQIQACIHAGLINVQKKKYIHGDECFTKALFVLKKFKSVGPEAAVYHSRIKVLGHRARCRLAMENWQGAAEDARAGLQFQADWIDGYRLLCRALQGANNWQKALAACEHILAHVPQDLAFRQIKTELERKCAENTVIAGNELPAALVASQQDSSPDASVSESSECDEVKQLLQQHTEPDIVAVSNASVDSDGSALPAAFLNIERFAQYGSVVAQRYLAAHKLLVDAHELLASGDLQRAMGSCRDALQLWPEMEIPNSIVKDLKLVGSHDAIAWGGPALYFHMQAPKIYTSTSNGISEREYWRQAVERYPEDPALRMKLAFVLYGGDEVNGALENTETALRLAQGSKEQLLWTSSLEYLRACCTAVEPPSSWLSNLFVKTREGLLLTYVQQSSMDEQWVPYALYSLAMLRLAKGDYVQAKLFQYLAQATETRRSELGLFAAIDDNTFLDKNTLQKAFCGRLAVLNEWEQQEAVASGTMTCGWCQSKTIPVDQYVQHKTGECTKRPASLGPWERRYVFGLEGGISPLLVSLVSLPASLPF